MVLLRVGYEGHPLAIYFGYGDDIYDSDHRYDSTTFGYMVVNGFVFITLIQIISISVGEKSPVLVSEYVLNLA